MHPSVTNKLKIAMIVSMKSGLTRFMFRDIDALAAKGHEVTLMTLRSTLGLYNPRPAWPVVRASAWQALAANLWWSVRRPLQYLRLWAEAWRTKSLIDFVLAVQFAPAMRDADVIFAYFGDHKLFVGYYCKKLLQKPLLVTVRAYELHCNPNPPMLRRALTECERILTVSEFNKERLVAQFDAPAERVEVVRQIIDLDELQPDPKIKVLIVGFFAEKKGHDILFEALRRLKRNDIELWVVGDNAPDRNNVDCRQMASELGITHQVAFFGSQSGNALRALYRECDVFCLPSRTDRYGDKEGFPNVIAEAMAMGKPVVSTRHAGIPEVVDALLVDEDSPAQLAEALSAACDDAALRQRLGRRNRAAAERLFSPANNDRLEQLLWQHSVGKSAAAKGNSPQGLALEKVTT